MKKILFVGDGKMALDCLRVLLRRPAAEIGLVVYDPEVGPYPAKIARLCEKHGLEAIAAPTPNRNQVVDRVREIGPDLGFTVNSFKIIRRPLLEIPPEGILNFHNGPLPAFRGVNIPTWAILAGAAEHAVTWHFIDEGIDTGDLVGERRFAVSPRETALSLIVKCITHGVALFEEIVDDILEGRARRAPQRGKARYYSRRDVPNDGYVDFAKPVAEVDRFVRALEFRPHENLLTYARARHADRSFIINSVEASDSARGEARPGEVLDCDGVLRVAAGDGVVRITEVMSDDETPLAVEELVRRLGIRPGCRLEGHPAPPLT